ncbi:hypothetical protein ACQKQD_31540 [Methylobacterium sp. NPDC080182]|uniref:hypothetical protein n=1 Tax=Methylobacterium sp. NPDC080182 TaxID=3390590 RepID=UPI003D022826
MRFGMVREEVERVLRTIEILPYASGRTGLRYYSKDVGGRGQGGWPNDLLIAAQAHSLATIFVTDRACEFERIDGLRVVNQFDPSYSNDSTK